MMISYKRIELDTQVRVDGKGLVNIFVVGDAAAHVAVDSITREGDTVTIAKGSKVIDVPWAQCRHGERVKPGVWRPVDPVDDDEDPKAEASGFGSDDGRSLLVGRVTAPPYEPLARDTMEKALAVVETIPEGGVYNPAPKNVELELSKQAKKRGRPKKDKPTE